jgi:AcrR family transcriptional regulator
MKGFLGMTRAPVTIADAADNEVNTGQEPGRQRKRGAELEQAIRDATVAELASGGYGNLTIESVAARAQTGKASIYRRWPTKHDLVFDSVGCLMAGEMGVGEFELDEQVSTRDALLHLARHAALSMSGSGAPAMRSIMSESLRDELFCSNFQDNYHDPRKERLNEVLERGMARGEVRAGVTSPLLIDILAGALIHRYLIRRQPVVESELVEFIDGFVMPALRAP